MNQVITVSILDDHKVVTDGLRSVLNLRSDIQVTDVSNTVDSLMAQLVDRQPDVLILDYSLSSTVVGETRTGLTVAEDVLSKYPHVKILMLSMHESADVIVPCIEIGVHGYMLKSERDFDIAGAIRQVMENGAYFSPEIATQLALSIQRYKQDQIDITDRELEILEALFQGCTAKEAGIRLGISPKTVESHRKNLMEKFRPRMLPTSSTWPCIKGIYK